MRINRNNSTSRSINAAGTVNASGADYAEYERKRHDCGNVPKGAVVGFDVNGLVTDKWSASVRFGVKSTDPSYVGGDVWGTPDAIGLAEPVAPSTPRDDSDAWRQYIVDRTAYDVALEGARQTVDRIAYAGKCPVNIVGAPVGSWIIAEGTVDDKIACVYVASLTTEDYAQTNTLMERCVGRVNKILPDGRAEIVVRP
jgi:hypothetical protein